MWPKCQILNNFQGFQKSAGTADHLCGLHSPATLSSCLQLFPPPPPAAASRPSRIVLPSPFLNKNNEIFHKHEFVPQVSPEYQTLHLHWTFAQDSAALSGTTKFTVTAPFWVVTNIFLLTALYGTIRFTLTAPFWVVRNIFLLGEVYANIISEIYDDIRHEKDHL